MKILVLTDLFPTPSDPGHGIFIYQWAYHLAQECDMTVYQAVWTDKDHSYALADFETFQNNYDGKSYQFNWIQKSINLKKYDRIWVRTLQFWNLIKNERNINYKNYDLIIGQMGCPGGYTAVKLAQKYKKPSIVGLRGSDVTSYLKAPILKNLAKWTYSKCDHIVTVSDDLRKQLIAKGIFTDKITTIKNGINPLFTTQNKQTAKESLGLNGQQVILYVGHLIPIKGVKYLIQAFSLIQKQSNYQLYLIGTGEEEPRLRNLVTTKNLADRIHFIGNVSQPGLVQWYNAADIFCLPSLREGIPNVILEALACGTPVVATDISNNSDIINEANGFLVQPENAVQLAEAIEKAISKNWNRKIISESVANFRWKKNRSEYLKLIDTILNQQR